MKKIFFILTILFFTVTPFFVASAASVTAGSGITAGRDAGDSGSASWIFTTPTTADTITWTSGDNFTDRKKFPKTTWTETKFDLPRPTGRTFTGFTKQCGPGPSGSTTSKGGYGGSNSYSGSWGTDYVSAWSVFATGKLGPKGLLSWHSEATGDDPMYLFLSMLEDVDITAPTIDIFFGISLEDGGIPLGTNGKRNGEIGLKASYEDSSGTTDIIDISIDSSGATVTGSTSPTFYTMSSLDEGPTEISANLTSLASIQTLLNTDVSSDYSIDSPMYLGIVLEDVLLPTSNLSNGALAAVHVDSFVADADAAPEPDTLLLMISGLIGIAVISRRFKFSQSGN